jgi:hypothetical protein
MAGEILSTRYAGNETLEGNGVLPATEQLGGEVSRMDFLPRTGRLLIKPARRQDTSAKRSN